MFAISFLTDPIAWWVDPFTDNVFMRDALYAGLLAVLATSVVGIWVVLRGMSFLGDALAHGVLPGIAIAFITGQNLTLGAIAAALLMVGGVNLLRNHSPLPEDTSIGVLFVGFLALGVVIMSRESSAYSGDLNRFLFGSILGITSDDLLLIAGAAALSIIGVVVFYRALLVMTFDETQALLLGLRPRLANAVLLVLLAFSIVASFRVVGNLLVVAFLIAPPAAASLLVRRVPVMMAAAVTLGSVAVVVGLLVAFHEGTAPGATMALVSVLIFLAVVVGRAVATALGAGPQQRTV